jgi:hypothetical protein
MKALMIFGFCDIRLTFLLNCLADSIQGRGAYSSANSITCLPRSQCMEISRMHRRIGQIRRLNVKGRICECKVGISEGMKWVASIHTGAKY